MTEYTGPYKVVKVFRQSGRKQVLGRGFTLEEARNVVKSYPDSNKHMVVFYKQSSAAKYYKTVVGG